MHSDFVLILSLLYCWIFGGFAFVLGCAWKNEKNKSVKLSLREGKLKKKLILNHFFDSH